MRASDWIKVNVRETTNLRPEVLDIISDFTLMWSLFEASESDDGGNVDLVQQITRLSVRLARDLPLESLDDFIVYWSNRYFENTAPNGRFSYLNFSEQRQIDVVSRALTDLNSTLQVKIEACLLIVYRYRNNLFHGLKDIIQLNDQFENFNTAVRFLQFILPNSGRHIFLGVKI